jgi:hypothetical protein
MKEELKKMLATGFILVILGLLARVTAHQLGLTLAATGNEILDVAWGQKAARVGQCLLLGSLLATLVVATLWQFRDLWRSTQKVFTPSAGGSKKKTVDVEVEVTRSSKKEGDSIPSAAPPQG